MRKLTIFFAAGAFLLLLAITTNAQQGTLTLYNNPQGTRNAGNGDVATKIVANYSLYADQYALKMDITWDVTPTNYLFYGGKVYTRQQLGDDVFSQLTLSKSFRCEADAMYQGVNLGKVSFDASTCSGAYAQSSTTTCTGNHAGGGTNDGKSDVFPARTFEEAKSIWVSGGIKFANFRLVQNAPSIYKIDLVYAAIQKLEAANEPENTAQNTNQQNKQPQNTSSNSSSQNSPSSGSNNSTSQPTYNGGKTGEQIYNETIERNNAILENTAKLDQLVTTGVQVAGDIFNMIKEDNDRREREEEEARRRQIEAKKPIYEAELKNSQRDVNKEPDPELQTLLTNAYLAPLNDKLLNNVSFKSKLFVPQNVVNKNTVIESSLNKVTATVNGRQHVVIDNIVCPKIQLSPSGNKLLIAYYNQGDEFAKVAVYDVATNQILLNETTVEYLREILGFNETENEVCLSRINERNLNLTSEIIKINVTNGRQETIKLVHTFSILFEHATRLLNNRYVMAYEQFKRFIAIYDLQSDKVAYLPANVFNDFESFHGDTLVGLVVKYVLYVRFDALVDMFTLQELTKFDKHPKNRLETINEKLTERLSGIVGMAEIKTADTREHIEDLVHNRVYDEETGNLFEKMDVGMRKICNSVFGLMCKVTVFAGTDAYMLQTNPHMSVALINNSINILSAEYQKGYELDYFPVKVLDFNDNNMTVLGVDRYGFAIVKVYDFATLYSKYNIKG